MAYAMTKRGSLDNCVTYEFICDTVADMNAIEDRYRTIGSTAVVLQGDAGLEVYISGSDKIWTSLSVINSSGSVPSGGGLSFHICGQDELDANGLPDVSEPDEVTFYLVPAADETTGNIYDEYIYVDDEWEKFGSGKANGIDLSNYATLSDISGFYTKPDGGIPAADLANNISLSDFTNDVIFASEPVSVTPVVTNLYSDKADWVATIKDKTTKNIQRTATLNVDSEQEQSGDITVTYTLTDLNLSAGETVNYQWSYSLDGGTTWTLLDETTNHFSYIWSHEMWKRSWKTEVTIDTQKIILPDTSLFAPKANPEFTGSVSLDRYTGSTVGDFSVSLGRQTKATGDYSFAEGNYTTASGSGSHAEGQSSVASGSNSHAEGLQTKARGKYSHAEGQRTSGTDTITYNNTTYYYGASGDSSHSEGKDTIAHGDYSHAEGNNTKALNTGAHAEGDGTIVSGVQGHAEGGGTIASGAQSHAEGTTTRASGSMSHAEGMGTTASGLASHSEGSSTTASGTISHAEGVSTVASGDQAHAEGSSAIASGISSHAEGTSTFAFGHYSHAEGAGTAALDMYSHTEGAGTIASGQASHSEGLLTQAIGAYEHVSGQYNVTDSAPAWVASTSYNVGDLVSKDVNYINKNNQQSTYTCIYKCKTANSDSTFTSSKWEISGKYAEIIGNGTATNARSNARTLDWAGNERLMGDLYVGCNADSTGGTKVAKISDIPDVQVNGTSIVSNGVANIPVASSAGDYGVVKINSGLGVGITEDMLYVAGATNDMVKVGTQAYKPIVPSRQHMSVFYGLAKAAGFDEKYSELALGTYTADAKSAISNMLNAPETVSGTAVSITAKSGIRYECGEVVTLTITLPATGDCEFIFESGSTPTVLTITPPTGVTAVKWPEWFDPEDLEADTTYDIIITNGRYGVVTSWA